MRQSHSAPLPGAWVVALLLACPALAQMQKPTQVAYGSELPTVQLIGWSADEQRYAFRVFSHYESEFSGEELTEEEEEYQAQHQDKEGFCKGYVNTQGKRFKGALQLVVFERDQRLVSIPIQDEPKCTPAKVAAQRLAEAKKKLAELGIDMARPGKDLPLVPGKRVKVTPEKQPAYELEFVSKIKEQSDPEHMETRQRGMQELNVYREGKKETVFSRKVDKRIVQQMGDREEESMTSAHVSPSGERVVVMGYKLTGNMRGYEHTLRVGLLLGWPDGVIAQEK